jgi:hypothetical protein
MTRLFTDGAEMGDAEFWDGNNNITDVVVSINASTTPTPIGGEWCYKGGYRGAWKLVPGDLDDFYVRYRLRSDNVLSDLGGCSYASMFGFRHGDTHLYKFSIDELGRFCFIKEGGLNAGTVFATSNYVMKEDTWYLIELHIFLDVFNGRLEAFVDGEQIIDFTGITLTPSMSTHIDNMNFWSRIYTNVYVDDIAFNDTNGVEDNSWCGDGIVTKMIPNGNGDVNDWTNSDGDSVDNYTYVDEFPNDEDTTFVYCDKTLSGTQEKYTLSDLSYTNKTVLRIYPEARVIKTSPSNARLRLGILPSGGVDDVSVGKVLYSDYYARIVGNDYLLNPFDSDIWEELDLDALQVIAEVE